MGTRPFPCALGPISPMPNARQMPSCTRVAHDLAFGFEVVATLDPRTNSAPTRQRTLSVRKARSFS
jgi:hypothetical protein